MVKSLLKAEEKKTKSERNEDKSQQNKKWIESLRFENLPVEERITNEERWRTMKNDEKCPQNRLRKYYKSVTEALRLDFSSRKCVFFPKIAEMHRLRVMNILKQPPSPIYRGKGRCLPPRGFLRKIFKRTPITKFTPLFILYGKVTEALWKCFGFDFFLFFSSLSPMLSEICLPKVFRNFTEVLRKPWKPFFKNMEELATQLLPH